MQGYLKEFNELYEELQGKKVEVFAVCAEPQAQVDKAMKEWGLKYRVSEKDEDMDKLFRSFQFNSVFLDQLPVE